MPCARIANEEDCLIWAATSNGEFNLNNAYLLACELKDSSNSFNGKWIWKLNVLPRIQSFIWLCFHKSIATRECLASRGIHVDTSCPICHQASKSIIYTLRDCTLAINHWQNLSGDDAGMDFFTLELSDWLKKCCCQNSVCGTSQITWSTIFVFRI